MGPVKREWFAARAKVGETGQCRICGVDCLHRKVDAAHVIGRTHDPKATYKGEATDNVDGSVWVTPDRIVPLCGPATDTGTCHNKHDSHDPDFQLLPYLTIEEQLQAVADAGGIELARNRLVGRNLR